MGKKVVKERVLKCIFDFSVSALLIIISSPFLLSVAILLKLEGFLNPAFKGPVFFREIRVSGGRRFWMYKFRTVKSDILQVIKKEKKSITDFTAKRDKNKYLTPIGTFMANRYLDEFPQIFNVIKGDMSLVGPRPHVPEHYESDLKSGMVSAKYIKAGMMGLVQASKGNAAMRRVLARMASKHATKDKTMIFIDRLYYRKYLRAGAIEMVLYDIQIIFRCLLVVLKAEGI